jgi:hypothetical protein
MASLEEALQRSRKMIEAALAEARTELSALEARGEELRALIAQGESALGGTSVGTEASGTLHNALARVLREGGNEPMTARVLADVVNERGLYRKRDGGPVEVNQVHARTNNYPDLFEKQGSLIRLRTESRMLDGLPETIEVFKDDRDTEFFSWLDEHPDSYFINTERNPKPGYLVMHRPSCPHFDRSPSAHWTRDYIKFCSDSRSDLDGWAANAVGGEATLCRRCFG